MREEIISFLRREGYFEISEQNGAPFPIFYKQKEKKIEAILFVYRELNSEERKRFQNNLIQNLKYSMEEQVKRPVSFVTWMVLSGEPGKEERILASQIENLWFISKQDRKLYVFDEVPPLHLGLCRQIEALLMGDLEHLRVELKRERKKQQREDWKEWIGRITPVNTCLVIVNILLFLLFHFSGNWGTQVFSEGVLNWKAVFYGKEYYRLITAMFLHFGVSHLCNNMLFLFLIGSYLERIVGKIRYLVLYFISGMGAGIVSCIFYWYQNADVVSAGASGALFGVVGALLYIMIRNKGRLEEMNLRSFLIMLVGTLSVGFASTDVDNAAHIGGLVIGFLAEVFIYTKKYRRKV